MMRPMIQAMKLVSSGVLAAIVCAPSVVAADAFRPPETADGDWAFARELAAEIAAAPAVPFARTRHSDAEWFPHAGFGLFMHWGIHSVKGVQPSWAMIKDYPAGGDPDMYPPERYYAMAADFDPDAYDPDPWMRAAKEAGFTYAVLTAKHHDGYALWPSAYGAWNTRTRMGGRDLLEPYIAACRNHGLKVGLYFSPRDWSFPEYPIGDVGFDYNKRDTPRHIADAERNRERFEAFYAYTVGQLHELLTRYGRIDLLWFDGMGWDGIEDIRTAQTLAWIRELQPGIVMNDRWGGVGDYTTPEWDLPEGRPFGWWENCISWNGHWGYNPEGAFQPNAWVLDRLTRARAWGGNFLLNVGPAPDGTMPPGYYERCAELAAWMAHSGPSLIGAGPSPGEDRADAAITTRGNTWYLHVPPGRSEPLSLRYGEKPASVVLLRTGAPVPHEHDAGVLRVTMPEGAPPALHDVVAVTWTENRWEDRIQAFERQDASDPPGPGQVLFVGSSSIVGWDLNRDFPGLDALNRGFGGSQYADALFHAERIILPYRPRTIVLYDGENDLHSGKSPEWVIADFRALLGRIRHVLPETHVIVLSMKINRARWELRHAVDDTNERIRAVADKEPFTTYLDVNALLLAPDGTPRDEFFLADKLHLSPEGYAVWSDALRPLLED